MLEADASVLGTNHECVCQVSGSSRNLHSGVDGGAAVEPLADLVAVLATLTEVCEGAPSACCLPQPGMRAVR